MLKAVFLQIVATLLAAAIAAVFFGLRGTVSAAWAGLAVVLPSVMFAWLLGRISRRIGTASVTAFVAGELIKLVAIVGMLVLFLALYPDVHWGGLLIGLILALKANLFAFLVKT